MVFSLNRMVYRRSNRPRKARSTKPTSITVRIQIGLCIHRLLNGSPHGWEVRRFHPCGRCLSITNLVPTVPDQRQDDDQAVKELDVEPAKTGTNNAGLDEGHRSVRRWPHQKTVPTPPRLAFPRQDGRQDRKHVTVACGGHQVKVDHGGKNSRDRCANPDENKGHHAHALTSIPIWTHCRGCRQPICTCTQNDAD